jgi:hypothetical protein
MKTFSFKADKKELADALVKSKAIAPQIVVMFAAPGFFNGQKDIEKACADAGVNVIGCSTAGEISADGVSDDSFSVMAIHFDATDVKTAQAQLTGTESSRQAGLRIGQQLAAPNLSSIFVLSPGLNVNGSEFVRGISDAVGKNVVITGGLAGDGTSFGKTHTLLNGKVYEDHAVAFGLYGDKVHVRSGSRGGWKPFGAVRRVTKAVGNVLYELDGKPALKLYKEYLGDKAAGLPASGLLYPFAILREEDRQETGLIRTILDVDHQAESLTMAGDLPQGSLVSLMYADTDSLVDGAGEAAEEASIKGRKGNSATLLVSCVGRKIIMGGSVDEEVEAVIRAIGANSVFAGFYSYGEICPFSETGFSELHNQTMTITHISEEDVAA